VLVVIAIRRDEQFRHRDCRGHGLMPRPFHPRKDGIGEREIAWICFQLVDKNAGVEGDPAMTPEK